VPRDTGTDGSRAEYAPMRSHTGDEAPEKRAEAPQKPAGAEWQASLAGLDWDHGPHGLWIEYRVSE
jgi:hypothetical protein